MKTTAIAPANIAFIKFFGKTNESLRLPTNSSISMCLSKAFTTTTVEFAENLKEDSIEIKNDKFKQDEKKRVIHHLNRIRKLAKINLYARVVTENNFPKSSGIASSASGFAALTYAATYAGGLKLSEKQLSILARLASGSACRSIPDGFVEWKWGNASDDSYAYSLYPADYWEILDILAIVEKEAKSISTTDAHKLAFTSPFFAKRIVDLEEKITSLKQALREKNFKSLGQIAEAESLNMYGVMITTTPPLFYWTEKTVELILAVWNWRKQGIPVYFTFDAGPNLHLLCEGKNGKNIITYLKKIRNIKQIIVNKTGYGSRLTNSHLF